MQTWLIVLMPPSALIGDLGRFLDKAHAIILQTHFGNISSRSIKLWLIWYDLVGHLMVSHKPIWCWGVTLYCKFYLLYRFLGWMYTMFLCISILLMHFHTSFIIFSCNFILRPIYDSIYMWDGGLFLDRL